MALMYDLGLTNKNYNINILIINMNILNNVF